MGFGLRVKFTPNVQPREGGAIGVAGGTLAFVQFGKPSTVAKRDEPKPAKLVFHGAFLDHARDVSEPDFFELASLEGTIALRGTPAVAVFSFEPEANFTYVEPEPPEGALFRELHLAYDDGSFDSEIADGEPLTRLRLPEEPEGTRFFELTAQLEIDGSVEAALLDNHRLDVPLGPLPGPLFEWPDELTDGLPDGLTLTLEEDGVRMSLDWIQGEIFGGLRRFTFSSLKGDTPCTLTAVTPSGELVLLRDQIINDPASPIRWEHFLEELCVEPSAAEDDEVEFLDAMPEIVGTV